MICCMGRLLDVGSLSRTWLITSWNTSNSGFTIKLMKPTAWHEAWLLNQWWVSEKYYRSEIGGLLWCSCHTAETRPVPSPSPCPPGWRTPPCTWLSTPCANPRPWWGGPRLLSEALGTSPWSCQPWCQNSSHQWWSYLCCHPLTRECVF